ncbi:MAG: amidohydrolase family protein, partial [Chloroflexi bacterium]|nr:amidohydrolase family protein [Chloroflexota bacterium]
KVMPPLAEEELAEGMALVDRHNRAYGITSLQEASAVNDYRRWQRLQAIKQAGQLKTRIYMMFGYNALGQFREAGLAQGAGDGHLRLGGVKIIVNKASGRLWPSPPELGEMVWRVNQAGFQVAIHAVEQGEVEAAIGAYEHVGSRTVAQQRHRIEHCSECPQPLLKRLSKLKATVVTQPPFVYHNGERYLATIAPEVLPTLYRVKSFLDSSLVVGASSDYPVVPANPMAGLYGAVTRRAASGQELLPWEGITLNQAIALYTLGSAYASFEESIKGSITPGKLADVLVLSDDITRLPPAGLKDVKVLMTIIDGKIEWEA